MLVDVLKRRTSVRSRPCIQTEEANMRSCRSTMKTISPSRGIELTAESDTFQRQGCQVGWVARTMLKVKLEYAKNFGDILQKKASWLTSWLTQESANGIIFLYHSIHCLGVISTLPLCITYSCGVWVGRGNMDDIFHKFEAWLVHVEDPSPNGPHSQVYLPKWPTIFVWPDLAAKPREHPKRECVFPIVAGSHYPTDNASPRH